jgi:hypothetical protein
LAQQDPGLVAVAERELAAWHVAALSDPLQCHLKPHLGAGLPVTGLVHRGPARGQLAPPDCLAIELPLGRSVELQFDGHGVTGQAGLADGGHVARHPIW